MTQPYPGLSGGDRTWIYAVTPYGERIYLSGKEKAKQGVEFSRGLTGLDRAPTELVWLQEARQNGADLAGSNLDIRTIRGAVNILGNTARQMRAADNLWNRAASVERYGQLYFINSFSGVRWVDYLYGESANASLDRDPAIRKTKPNYPFTWVCPNPYFKGYEEEFAFAGNPVLSSQWREGTVKLRNMGDAERTYPLVYLKGPGIWRIPTGLRDDVGNLIPYDSGNPRSYIELPALKLGEEAWLDTDPRTETITLNRPDGQQINLWAQMKAQRPRLWLRPNRAEEWTMAVKGGSSEPIARVVVQPLYNNWQ